MTVIRIKHNRENPYVQINKESLWDERLSCKAVTLLVRCMSRPDDWKFHVVELASKFKEGRKTVDSAIHELIQYGYAVRIDHWDKDEAGRFKDKGHEYVFFETPATQEDKEKVLEEFKKCFQHCRFGKVRSGNFRKGPLLISSSSKKNNEEESNPAASPPGSPPIPKKPKKIREELVDRVDRVQTTPLQHTSLIQKLGAEERVQKAYIRLSEWKIGKGIGFTSGDYQRICNWVIDALNEKETKKPMFQPALTQPIVEPQFIRADFKQTVSIAVLQREQERLKRQMKPNYILE